MIFQFSSHNVAFICLPTSSILEVLECQRERNLNFQRMSRDRAVCNTDESTALSLVLLGKEQSAKIAGLLSLRSLGNPGTLRKTTKPELAFMSGGHMTKDIHANGD